MNRIGLLGLALVGLLILAAGSIATSSAKAPWKIALGSNREGEPGIYSMNADGTGVRRLTGNARDFPGSWSADGRKFVYGSSNLRLGDKGEIYVMNADGSGKRRLTRHEAFDCCPVWSPDGTKILFTSDRDGNGEIYVMNADGSDPRNLTRHRWSDGREGGLIWSPDGRKIAFGTNRDGNTEIYAMNADGSGQRRLTRTPGDKWALSFSPDGRQLAFAQFPLVPMCSYFFMNAYSSFVRKVNCALPRNQ